ncbi:DUF2891 domain-containing protein [Kushneria marisflavi]|uniref:Uncharacterized protein n=1 Tax=Kushneria marisflavi TaxID=157779 RepID=A0A240UQ14_9GAMM|nr:DUF2891 domain-containing protein [Kushneria marisflavi]ART63132.1 hypothetical protein B9H00_08755 [Kushneria marisflavi]RKD84612.1 hypothetical protein C8D96_1835 [Kushneria marisflavi]
MSDLTSCFPDQTTLEGLAHMALGHVEREYPNLVTHMMRGAHDIAAPSTLHPIFYGSLDWHSCVHSYWLLVRVSRLYPTSEIAARVQALLQRNITTEKVAGELAYFQAPGRDGFERPYGWAWFLKLVAELETSPHEAMQQAAQTLAPLIRFMTQAFLEFWPKQTYPIRTGTHYNSAFAGVMALEYARMPHQPPERTALEQVLCRRAREWFDGDRGAQAWEPGGDEFLSPTLIEALYMAHALEPEAFRNWFDAFLPALASGQPETLFIPAVVSDRSDGKIAHLDGLNLSRAWCFRSLAARLGQEHPARLRMQKSAETHLAAALSHLGEDYMGEHWLATLALLALEA